MFGFYKRCLFLWFQGDFKKQNNILQFYRTFQSVLKFLVKRRQSVFVSTVAQSLQVSGTRSFGSLEYTPPVDIFWCCQKPIHGW